MRRKTRAMIGPGQTNTCATATRRRGRFGWSKRSATPGTKTEGNALIGYGMATATYPANRSAAQAVVRLLPAEECLWFGNAGPRHRHVHDHGAAGCGGTRNRSQDGGGKLGDSTLPKAPVSGGSQSSASVLPAIQDATTQLKLSWPISPSPTRVLLCMV